MAMLHKIQIIGKRLVKVLQNRWSKPEYIVEGIGPARYSKMVYELDNALQFESGWDELLPWNSSEDLIPLEIYGERNREYLGQSVTEVVAGSQNEHAPSQVYVILGNGTVLCSGYYLDLYGSANLVCGVDTLTEYDPGPFKTLWERVDWSPNAV
jgi:hypothetical protein